MELTTKLVQVDSRRRVSLGTVLEADRYYRATAHSDGTIVLEPVTAYTREEFAQSFPGVRFPESPR